MSQTPKLTTAQKAGVAGAGAAAVLALATPVVMRWEGLRLDPYKDVAGISTVCWGETNVPMRSYTRAECDAMLQRSIEKHAGPVLACLPEHAPLQVKVAFVSFGYNVGTSAACGSVAAQHVRAGRYIEACNALMNWTYAGGRKIQGLVNRRQDERSLCLQGATAVPTTLRPVAEVTYEEPALEGAGAPAEIGPAPGKLSALDKALIAAGVMLLVGLALAVVAVRWWSKVWGDGSEERN